MPRRSETLRCYLVGGAVRDALLGLPVEDRDWVVVGGDAETMIEQGFRKIDAAFPVFLHPGSREEYALARRERKSGQGYRGFEVEFGPEVTLEEDLSRRDLTINAMAQDDAGTVIDPFGGQDDLAQGLLRHVSPAFVEDPLRVLRVARFAARLGPYGFRVAHGTHRLMREMAESGELDALTAERVWRETIRAMQAPQPWRYFEVLHRCGALAVLLPDLDEAMGEPAAHGQHADSVPIRTLKRACEITADAATRLAAALVGVLPDTAAVRHLMQGLRADKASIRLLQRAVEARAACAAAAQGDRDAIAELALAWHGVKPPAAREGLIQVCLAQQDTLGLDRRLEIALTACDSITSRELLARGLQGEALGQALTAARREAIQAALAAETG